MKTGKYKYITQCGRWYATPTGPINIMGNQLYNLIPVNETKDPFYSKVEYNKNLCILGAEGDPTYSYHLIRIKIKKLNLPNWF